MNYINNKINITKNIYKDDTRNYYHLHKINDLAVINLLNNQRTEDYILNLMLEQEDIRLRGFKHFEFILQKLTAQPILIETYTFTSRDDLNAFIELARNKNDNYFFEYIERGSCKYSYFVKGISNPLFDDYQEEFNELQKRLNCYKWIYITNMRNRINKDIHKVVNCYNKYAN